jgi:hypothetical protein
MCVPTIDREQVERKASPAADSIDSKSVRGDSAGAGRTVHGRNRYITLDIDGRHSKVNSTTVEIADPTNAPPCPAGIDNATRGRTILAVRDAFA